MVFHLVRHPLATVELVLAVIRYDVSEGLELSHPICGIMNQSLKGELIFLVFELSGLVMNCLTVLEFFQASRITVC